MLDAITHAQLWHALLRRVRENGLTVLPISHDDELMDVAASPGPRTGRGSCEVRAGGLEPPRAVKPTGT